MKLYSDESIEFPYSIVIWWLWLLKLWWWWWWWCTRSLSLCSVSHHKTQRSSLQHTTRWTNVNEFKMRSRKSAYSSKWNFNFGRYRRCFCCYFFSYFHFWFGLNCHEKRVFSFSTRFAFKKLFMPLLHCLHCCFGVYLSKFNYTRISTFGKSTRSRSLFYHTEHGQMTTI